jgi:hypothetical protein
MIRHNAEISFWITSFVDLFFPDNIIEKVLLSINIIGGRI